MTGTPKGKIREETATPAVTGAVTGLRIDYGGAARRPVALAELLARPAAAGDAVEIIFVDGHEVDPAVTAWMKSEARDAVVAGRPGRWEIRWRPGRAVIRGPAKFHDRLLAAVLAVDGTDRQLREIDRAIAPIEAAAPADVEFAYSVSITGRSRWKRFDRTMKTLSGLRLSLAKCDPGGSGAETSPITRRAAEKLAARCRLVDRAELISDRLEALEDLYEGAVDRIVDHRWYVIGITVEIVIVLLLAAETLLLIFRAGR
jgi:hypothetical protein